MRHGNLKELYPDVASQFHPLKNTDKKVEDFNFNSSLSVWWQCNIGADHVWKTPISNRTKLRSNCPFCAGQKPCENNNLAASHPEIVRSWGPNNLNPPSSYLPFSKSEVEWVCSKDATHVWTQKILQRVKSQTGCPYCDPKSRIVTKDTSLATTYPELIKEWDFSKNTMRGLDPEKLFAGSAKKAWWVCNNGHSWESQIRHRTTSKTQCSYCSRRKANVSYNLAIEFPQLLKEWDYDKNASLSPESLVPGSGKRVWWKCAYGHSWQTDIYSRAITGSNCGLCSSQTSSPEIRIFSELLGLGLTIEQRAKINKTEVDILLSDGQIGIEYDGSYFHKDKEKSDLAKNHTLEKQGIKVVRVRCAPLKKISPHDILVDGDDIKKSDVDCLIKRLLTLGAIEKAASTEYLQKGYFINDSEYRRILSYLPSPTPENSLLSVCKDSSVYWDYDKNYPLKPENFTARSNRRVFWRCPEGSSHQWEGSIKDTFSKEKICSFCSKHRVSDEYNLGVTRPDLEKEWDYKKNSISPFEILPNYNKKVWWTCIIDKSHSWFISPNQRSSQKYGCPACSGRVASKTNNLAIKSPEVIAYWDYSKNTSPPEDYKSHSNKKVWWVCDIYPYHSWETSIATWTNNKTKSKSNCPFCADSNRRTHEFDRLEVQYPVLVKDFVRFSDKREQKTDINIQHYKSWKKCVWLCGKCKTTYSMPIAGRTSGKGCRRCSRSAMLATRHNRSLSDLNPDYLSEWDYTKNIDISPDGVTAISGLKFWWKCSDGHSYQQSIGSKDRGTICPECMKPIRAESARLSRLKKNGSLQDHFPDIASHWHPSKNGNLTPNDLTTGSHQKVWWRCASNHEWEMDANTITSKRSPYICRLCKNKKDRTADAISLPSGIKSVSADCDKF